MRGSLAIAAGVLAFGSPAAAQSTAQCPWMDAPKPPEQRAGELLVAMTIDDKVALTAGRLSRYGFAGEVPANDRLCIPAFVQSDGPAGIAGGFGGTQTGVTGYPVGMAQAATRDVALQKRLGAAMGQEALGKGANVLLGPAVNIARVRTGATSSTSARTRSSRARPRRRRSSGKLPQSFPK